MTRRPLIAANWKMNLTHTEAAVLAKELTAAIGNGHQCEVVVCPPFTALAAVSAMVLPGTALAGGGDVDPGIGLGAQNAHWEPVGAFTGEVSVTMLRALGCRYVIVGHSERRHLFGEDDATVAHKAQAVFAGKLVPILCVGETELQRREGQTEAVIGNQLAAVLTAIGDLDDELVAKLVVAYEPVWAIGSGQAAQPKDAAAVADFIRDRLAQSLGNSSAARIRILYGGSVNADNARSFLTEAGIDGALVGGAGLRADSFAAIVGAAGGVKGS